MSETTSAAVIYGGNTGTVGVTTIADGSAQRLQVQTAGDVGLYVPPPANYLKSALLNGTSSNLRVLGTSATPVTFKFSANATRGITVTNIMTVLSAGQIVTNGAYIGQAGTALANGILYQATQSGVTTAIGVPVKISEDFLTNNGDRCFDVSGAYAFGVINMECNVVLTPGSTDNVAVVIRDNLTSNQFTYLTAFAVGFYTS